MNEGKRTRKDREIQEWKGARRVEKERKRERD